MQGKKRLWNGKKGEGRKRGGEAGKKPGGGYKKIALNQKRYSFFEVALTDIPNVGLQATAGVATFDWRDLA